MTSDIITGKDPIGYERDRVKTLIQLCNDLYPAKHTFTFPHLDRAEAFKLNKQLKKGK